MQLIILCLSSHRRLILLQLNRIELSASLDKEQAKLQELKAQVASTSKRGHMQRLELWNILLPDIKDAIEKVLEDDTEYVNGLYCFMSLRHFVRLIVIVSVYYCFIPTGHITRFIAH